MVRAAGLAGLLLLAPSVAGAEVEVRVSGQAVEIEAQAPLSEVLAILSRQLRMELLYDGPPPRALVSLNLSARTPAEALQAVFEGLGVNYLLTADASGTGVATLLVFGGAPATPTGTPPGADPRLAERSGLRGRPPVPAIEELVPEPGDEDQLEAPLEAGNEAAGAPPADSFSGAVEAVAQGAAGAAPAAAEARPLFPNSPFNPVPPSLAPPAAAPAPPAAAQPFQP